MQTKLFFSESTNPWFNLAFEEYLVNTVGEDEVCLYLWQNQHTVVIGKHQNPWREVLSSELEKDGGRLARRLSGGGAVYHDLGNLNFTFAMNKKHEDLHRQLGVILEGVKSLGIDAEFSGRNDILSQGRKFSGNAFYHGRTNYYHHGTILVDVDMSKLGRYLNVSVKKLQAKGVESVKSRVINLKEINPEITIDGVKESVARAFEKTYGVPEAVNIVSEKEAPQDALDRYHHYASWEWRYGKTPEFDITFEEKFAWGEIVLSFKLKGAVIESSGIYSDAMSTLLVESMQGLFDGKRLDPVELGNAVAGLAVEPLLKDQCSDLEAWLRALPV